MESLFNKDNLNKVTEKENKILSEIPKNLTPIEKARYIYIQLGKYFHMMKNILQLKVKKKKSKFLIEILKMLKITKLCVLHFQKFMKICLTELE